MPIERRLGDGSRSEYTPYNLMEHYTDDQLRDEYRRLRRTLMDRVRRIVRSGEFPDSYTERSLERFVSPGRLTKSQLAMRLSELESMLDRKTSTLAGLREEQNELISTLHDRGFTNITKENIRDFTKFMNSTLSIATSILRYKYVKGRPTGEDRNKRLELFNTAMAKGISVNALIRDFRFFIAHIDEIKELPDRKTGRKLGTKSIRKMLKM